MAGQNRPTSRVKRVLLTGVWGVAFQVVTVLYQVVTVPLFLKFWGQDTYGDWLTVASLVSYLTLANLGMQSYVVNLLTQRYVKGEWGELAGEVSSATLMYMIALLLAFGALLGICLLVPLDHLFADAPFVFTGRLVTFILGARVAMMLFEGLVQGFYRIQGRADVAKLVHFLSQASVLGVVFVVLLGGWGPVELAWAELGAVMALVAFTIWDTRRRDRRVSLRLRGSSWGLAISFLGPSLLFFFNQLSSGLIFQGIVLVCSYLLGPRAVVTFSTTRVISNIVRQLLAFTCATMYPELTRIEAGRPERLAFTYRLLLKIVCAGAFFTIPVLFFSAPDLYQFWTRGRATLDLPLLRLLLLDIWLTAPMIASINVLFSTNKMQRIRQITIRNIIYGVAALVVIILLIRPVGLHLVGLVVAGGNLLFFGVAVPRWTQQEVGTAGGSFLRSVYLPYGVITALLMGVCWGCLRLMAPGIGRVLLCAGAAAAVGAPLFWFYLLEAEDRGFFLGLLRKLAGRLR